MKERELSEYSLKLQKDKNLLQQKKEQISKMTKKNTRTQQQVYSSRNRFDAKIRKDQKALYDKLDDRDMNLKKTENHL